MSTIWTNNGKFGDFGGHLESYLLHSGPPEFHFIDVRAELDFIDELEQHGHMRDVRIFFPAKIRIPNFKTKILNGFCNTFHK